MSMPNERTRAVIWATEFLFRLSRGNGVPVKISKEAKAILHHFPLVSDLGRPEAFDKKVIKEHYEKLADEMKTALNAIEPVNKPGGRRKPLINKTK
jgi:hypothetical protein